MRHAVAFRKLGRTTPHRRALLRNLVTSLIERDRIETTVAKAKAARRWADQMVTLAKTGTVAARRRAARTVADAPALRKLFGPLAERYRNRPGGYTRILQLGRRHGDAAPMAVLEFVV